MNLFYLLRQDSKMQNIKIADGNASSQALKWSSTETLSNECYLWYQTTCNVSGKHVHQRRKQCNIVPYMNNVRESIMIGNIEQMTSREQTSPELLAACHLSVDDVCMLSNV